MMQWIIWSLPGTSILRSIAFDTLVPKTRSVPQAITMASNIVRGHFRSAEHVSLTVFNGSFSDFVRDS